MKQCLLLKKYCKNYTFCGLLITTPTTLCSNKCFGIDLDRVKKGSHITNLLEKYSSERPNDYSDTFPDKSIITFSGKNKKGYGGALRTNENDYAPTKIIEFWYEISTG